MKVSVCVTIFNESQESINKLLNALNNQTLKTDEIIIIDGKDYNNCSRSEGRNIAIKKAKNEIIAITDAGCTPHKDWLEKITDPFKKTDSEVVAGGYQMVAQNNFEKAEAVFLGVKQQDIKSDFLPSARSMAFTKSIWKKAGGFPESLNDTAEDTVFNMKLIDAGARFVVARDAIVDWQMPKTIKEFANKIYRYAKGDAVSGIWWHPLKKWKTHNIKVLTIFMRYLILILLFLFNKQLCLIFVVGYMIYSYRKAGLWGIALQFISDSAIMYAFINYFLRISIKKTTDILRTL